MLEIVIDHVRGVFDEGDGTEIAGKADSPSASAGSFSSRAIVSARVALN